MLSMIVLLMILVVFVIIISSSNSFTIIGFSFSANTLNTPIFNLSW